MNSIPTKLHKMREKAEVKREIVPCLFSPLHLQVRFGICSDVFSGHRLFVSALCIILFYVEKNGIYRSLTGDVNSFSIVYFHKIPLNSNL